MTPGEGLKRGRIRSAVLLSLSLTSCGQIGAAFRSTDHFIKLVSDDCVLYEADAIDVAQQVAKNLNDSHGKVEKGHYSSFFKPVAIYVCASKESFAKYTGLDQKIKAAVFKDLMHTLETGMKFHQALTQTFKSDIDSLWIIFKNNLSQS